MCECERKRDGEEQEVYRTYLKSGLSFSCSVERSKIEEDFSALYFLLATRQRRERKRKDEQ